MPRPKQIETNQAVNRPTKGAADRATDIAITDQQNSKESTEYSMLSSM